MKGIEAGNIRREKIKTNILLKMSGAIEIYPILQFLL